MKKINRLFLTVTLLLSVLIYSCKKEKVETTANDNNATDILKISNTASNNRIDLVNKGIALNFESSSDKVVNTTIHTNQYPYQLVYQGKINSMVDANNNPLSALQVAAYGSHYAVSYIKTGDDYAGGVDIFQLESGAPQLTSSINTPNADITSITSGNGRIYLGMDLKNYETYDYGAPAVVGVVKTNGGSLSNPQIVPLNGYSIKDINYAESSDKLYVTSSTEGGLSIISFNGETAIRTAYQQYQGLRSITFAGNDLIATNGTSYSKFNSTSANILDTKLWPVPSNQVNIGSLCTLSNGNMVFGNNYYLIYVDKNTGNLIDQIDVGGWINSISVIDDKIYISSGNSLVVAVLENNHIKIIAKTHFESVFGGSFNVISTKVINDNIFVACGVRGTYIFKLKTL